jgi:hypothetical protein
VDSSQPARGQLAVLAAAGRDDRDQHLRHRAAPLRMHIHRAFRPGQGASALEPASAGLRYRSLLARSAAPPLMR